MATLQLMYEGKPIRSAGDETAWTQAIHDVNAFRGACLQHFSSAEAAVTETLLLLKEVPNRGETVRLRHLIGQRFDDLAKLVEQGGVFADEGSAVAKALSELRTIESFRTCLAHGQAKIALERNGQWVVIFRMIAIRAKLAERSVVVLEQADAEQRMADLKRRSQSLCSVLGNLRRSIVG